MSMFRVGRRDTDWSLDGVERPWPSDRPSILSFLHDAAVANETFFRGLQLPDEEWFGLPGMRFSPGLFDQTMMLQDNEEAAVRQAAEVVKALRQLCRHSNAKTFRELYHHVTETPIGGAWEEVDDILGTGTAVPADRLRSVGRVLIDESPDRDLVKLGLACLSLAGPDAADADRLVAVGRHGEFAERAATVARGRLAGWERIVWSIAKGMPGHGRSGAVNLLAGVEDPEIKHWMLLNGCEDDDYDHSAAFTCATTGGLVEAFRGGSVSAWEIRDVVQSLVRAEIFDLRGMRDVPGSAQFALDYSEAMVASERELWQYDIARSLKLYVSSKYKEWDKRPPPGWTDELRKEIRSATSTILEWPGWESAVRTALARGEHKQEALVVAHCMDLQMWEYWWEEAARNQQFSNWWRLCRELTPGRLPEFLQLAATRFGLDSPESASVQQSPHDRLDDVVSALGGFPGSGWPFVRTALHAPDVSARVTATRTLARWGEANWPPEARAELAALLAVEPDADQRDRLQATLNGAPDDTPAPIVFDDDTEDDD